MCVAVATAGVELLVVVAVAGVVGVHDGRRLPTERWNGNTRERERRVLCSMVWYTISISDMCWLDWNGYAY